MLKINFKKIIKFLFYTLIFLIFSFLIKYTALFWVGSKETVSNKIFELTYVRNPGAAFSLFSAHTDVLIILSFIILAVIISYVVKNSNRISNLKLSALSITTAGIIGNLFERIHDGFVTDYVKLNFINFPVFNSFDVLITLGAILLIITLYKNK